jgi:DNA processing protein
MNKKDLISWIWLSSLVKIIPKKKFQLIEHFKEPSRIWTASKEELASIKFVTPAILEQLNDRKYKRDAAKYLDILKRENIRVITINDAEYPFNLKNIYDPPIVLYIKGSFEIGEKMIAVVGARRATPYGCDMAKIIAGELSRLGITVVSGMARGIDSWAHRGALDSGGRTIAVLGCGADVIYPSENDVIAGEIAHNGAIVSEFVPGTPPIPINFPARNRIISGMSLGVIVIEAGEKSGSLITANHALEQGREVFALPGNVNSSVSVGTNKLIRDGAKIITGMEDILEELKAYELVNNNINCRQSSSNNERIFCGLSADERKLAECLLRETLHIDVLAQKSGLSIQITNSIVTMLELKGVVEQMPGKVYRLRS